MCFHSKSKETKKVDSNCILIVTTTIGRIYEEKISMFVWDKKLELMQTREHG